MHYRNKAWIDTFAAQFHGNQQHGRCVHVWRWERLLYVVAGADWETQAQNWETWKQCLGIFALSASLLR